MAHANRKPLAALVDLVAGAVELDQVDGWSVERWVGPAEASEPLGRR